MIGIGSPGSAVLDDEVVAFCSQLIRFDTSNFGGNECRAERPAAEWVAEKLTDAGYAPQIYESEPGRASTVVRIPGRDRTAPGLLVHGHLDVVPAQAVDWQSGPFSGDVRDDAVWGRGALDMKNTDAMMLAVVRGFARDGYVPPRDIVLAFVADEEDTGRYGAGYLVTKHPDLFDGVQTAIGETGGHTVHLPDGGRLYPIGTAERGSAWMKLTARGPAGHGSRRNPGNAVAALARAITRIADYQWPMRLIPTVATLLEGLQQQLGITVDPADPQSRAQLGEAARLVETTVANSLNPTMLAAGYKANVIPGEATAVVDGRLLPGTEEEFFATVDDLLGDSITREFVSYAGPVGTTHESPEFAAMAAAITEHDADALVLPFCMGGGTDAKAFTELGIACYGFAPGVMPPGFTHWVYVHGVDEHVPLESLRVGARMLNSYLRFETHPQEDER
ncbi:MAG: M20/M25/M40 family metallo-hydrolase [Jatrophihabitans sp.]